MDRIQGRPMSRRDFLRFTATAAGAVALSACGSTPAAPGTPTQATSSPSPSPASSPSSSPQITPGVPAAPTQAAPTTYKEAPSLAEQVKAGKLPPIQERLPKEPFVVKQGILIGDEFLKLEIGRYGGVLRLAQEAPTGDPHIFIGMNEPLLWAPDGFDYSKGIEGNVLAGYEVNADDTVFTFHMRPGLRWSDGEPVTIEDVKFAFEDVLYNKEITPVFPLYLRAGFNSQAAPAKLKVIDDFTFQLIFDRPYGTFPAQLAIGQWRGYAGIIKPKHYLMQFHKKYTPMSKLRKLAKEESIPEDQWYTLFNAKQLTEWMWNMTNEQGLGHPMLTPWVLKSVKGGVFTYERNPYYFKVDAAGNQLPYMDGIRSVVVQDKEALTTRALTGEFDFLGERSTMRKLSVMADEAQKGRIKLLIPRMHRLPINFMLNLTYKDPAWRKVTGDVRFRQALSLAINRKEILETFYLGEFARLPVETNPSDYDPERAQRLLDEIGLDKKDSSGYRLGPDGKRFTILFEIQELSEDHIPMAELIAEYWKKVGVYTTVKKVDPTVFADRWNTNKIMATSVWEHYEIWRSAGWDDYLPSNYWGQLWSQWYVSQGKNGETPPKEVQELYEQHKKFMSARIGTAESKAAMDAILRSHRENIWTFNPVEHSYYPTFFTPRVKNVPTSKSDVFGIIVQYSMEQWYLSEGD